MSSIIAEDTKVIDEKLNNIYNDRKEEHLHYGEVIEETGIGSTIATSLLEGVIAGASIAKGAKLISGSFENLISAIVGTTTVITVTTIDQKYSEDKKQNDINSFREEQRNRKEKIIVKTQKIIEDRVNELDYRINEKRIELINKPNMSVEERNDINQEINKMEEERRNLDEMGKQFIKSREAMVVNEDGMHVPYYDSGNLLTIGYGHLIKENEKATLLEPISEDTAKRLFINDIMEHVNKTNKLLGDTKLNQEQFNALVSLVYNVGYGNVKKSKTIDLITNNLNPNRTYKSLEFEFKEFCKTKNKKTGQLELNDGLKKRRDYEWNIFNNGNYDGIDMRIKNYYYNHKKTGTLYDLQNH